MSRELSPTFRRYWVKILENNQCISQFDPDGNYQLWSDEIQSKKIMFVPFSKEFSAKCKSKGNSCEPSNLPILEFAVKDNVQYYRNCTIRHKVYMSCNFCGAILDEFTRICPYCLGQNWWYCDICDELKKDFIVKAEFQSTNNAIKYINIPLSLMNCIRKIKYNIPELDEYGLKSIQIACPDCTELRGLLWIGCIVENSDETLDSVHVLDVDGEHHLIIDLVALK